MKAMLIDWLISIVYFALMVAWVPAVWAAAILQLGVFVIAAIVLLRPEVRTAIAGSLLRPGLDTIALVLLVLWGPLQIAASQTVYPFETWNNALGWCTLAAIYLVAKNLLHDRSDRQHFLSVHVWVGSTLIILSVLLFFSSQHKIFWLFPSRYSAYGPFVYKNHFAVLIELILPIVFYRMISRKKRRAPYFVLFAALIACMVASLSRAGVVIILLEVLVLAGISWSRRRLSSRALLNFGVPLALLVVAFTAVVGWDAAWSRFQEQNPLEIRNQLNQSTLEMVKAHPLVGYGLGTWQTVYPQYATFDIARVANQAHNDWLQWAADGGIPFVLVLLFFAIWISRFAFDHIWGLGVPAVFLHCLVDYPTRLPALAAFVFLFAGALAAVGDQPRRKAVSDSEYRILSVRTAAE